MAVKTLLVSIINILKTAILLPIAIWMCALFLEPEYHPPHQERSMLVLAVIGTLLYISVIALVFCTEILHTSHRFTKTMVFFNLLLIAISIVFPVLVLCLYPEERQRVMEQNTMAWTPILVWVILLLTMACFQVIVLGVFLVSERTK